MKITAVRPIFAQGERRTFVFIKVETDQPGLVGWGEATVKGKPPGVGRLCTGYGADDPGLQST